MPRLTPPFQLSLEDRRCIEQWLAAMGTPQQVTLRGLIVLGAARGESEAAIATELKINRKTVRLWKQRFAAEAQAAFGRLRRGADANRHTARNGSKR
jgi:hypothetical protein